MTMSEIAALVARIRELDAKATPGPWVVKENAEGERIIEASAFDALDVAILANIVPWMTHDESNAKLIVAYRTLAVQAADMLKAEHERAERLEAALRFVRSTYFWRRGIDFLDLSDSYLHEAEDADEMAKAALDKGGTP